MQLVLVVFGRAFHLTLNGYRVDADTDAAEFVALDGPSLEHADEDEATPFGFCLNG